MSKTSGTTVSYYVQDSLGSTLLVTSSSVQTLYSTNYKPYGLEYGASGTEPYKYTGQMQDSATGLYYLHGRYYDPDLGRFTSADPVAGHKQDPQTLNQYTYTANNPMSFTDPSGMDWWNPWTWTQQQQAQAFTVLVVVASIAAIILTLGAATPIAGPIVAAVVLGGIGASSASVIYTATAGSKATLGGAASSAFLGLLPGVGLGLGLGILGGTEPSLVGEGEPTSNIDVPSEFESTSVPGSLSTNELVSDETVYQYGNGPGYESKYLTPTKYASPAEAQNELALPGRNTAAFIREVTIPKGTTVFAGEVTPGFNQAGYGIQIWVSNWEPLIKGPWTALTQ